MKVLLIDNYDSFTYNLKQYLEEGGAEVTVCYNDDIPFDQISAYDGVVISPGPGLPEESGQLLDVYHHPALPPTLGICLGLQGMARAFGWEMSNMDRVRHGVVAQVQKTEDSDYLLKNLPSAFEVGLYHSWKVIPTNDHMVVTCASEDGVVMGARHTRLDIQGVQFHPESVMTPQGRTMIDNFLNHLNHD